MKLSLRGSLRVAAGTLALFIVANFVGELVRPPFQVLSEWLSFPGPRWAGVALGLATLAALMAEAVTLRVVLSARTRRAAAVVFGVLAALSIRDTIIFYATLARHEIDTPALLPASLFLAGLMVTFAADLLWPAQGPVAVPVRASVVVALAVLTGIPLLRMFTFGPTRYDRAAACVIVFGARVMNDGRPSDALADRVDEAVRLYHRGLVHKLLMSGGIDPHNHQSEPVIMKRRAVAGGVPDEAILLDEAGVDTAATVRNTAEIMRQEHLETALVVSHYYHEPRVKMLYSRTGARAYTVPARMRRRLAKEPFFVLREVLAFYHSFAFE